MFASSKECYDEPAVSAGLVEAARVGNPMCSPLKHWSLYKSTHCTLLPVKTHSSPPSVCAEATAPVTVGSGTFCLGAVFGDSLDESFPEDNKANKNSANSPLL